MNALTLTILSCLLVSSFGLKNPKPVSIGQNGCDFIGTTSDNGTVCIDLATQTVTPLSAPLSSNETWVGGIFDGVSSYYFVVGRPEPPLLLRAIDVNTGVQNLEVEIPTDPNDYDFLGAQLFWDNQNERVLVVSTNTNVTASVYYLEGTTLNQVTTFNSTTLRPFYTAFYNPSVSSFFFSVDLINVNPFGGYLAQVNADNGRIDTSIISPWFFFVFADYDPKTKMNYGLAVQIQTQGLWLVSVSDNETPVITTISQVYNINSWTGSLFCTLDWNNRILYYVLFDKLAGVNVDTGKSVFSMPLGHVGLSGGAVRV